LPQQTRFCAIGRTAFTLFIEKHQIGCLPIVTDGQLRGIITDTDFVGVAINLLELAEETEPLEAEMA
jgi:hypothetical protein